MKNCYEVQCKGGHVGKGYYYPMVLYIKAESRKDAAQIARQSPRVKHDHKDCIQSVRKISGSEYQIGQKKNAADGYYRACSKQEMQRLCPNYREQVLPETRAEMPETDIIKAPLSFRNRKKYINHYCPPTKRNGWAEVDNVDEEGQGL